MNKQKKNSLRWLFYALIGITFGIVDFLYIEPISRQFQKQAAMILFGLAWLIPSTLVALHEIRKTTSKKPAILASILTWVTGVIAYYTLYAITLSLDSMVVKISWGELLLDTALWSIAAAIGGLVVGFLVAIIYQRTTHHTTFH